MPLLTDRTGWSAALTILEAVSYRQPRQVTKRRIYSKGHTYPVCPRCNRSLEREYMSYCDRCGQCLAWEEYPYGQEDETQEEP